MKAAASGLAVALLVASCGGDGPGRAAANLEVFAAASLTDAFGAAGRAFTRTHSTFTVTFNFAGTPTLLGQLEQGAAADVFASADEANMQKAVDAGLVVAPATVFARNRLEIVVAPGNPKHVRGLADLARPDVLYIAEAPSVPAGKYGAQALAAAGVKANPRSLELDVRSVVGKIELGEADAGIVYVTDVTATGAKVSGVEIPPDQNVVAKYPIATVKSGRNQAPARDFVGFLLSREGHALLAGFGFASP